MSIRSRTREAHRPPGRLGELRGRYLLVREVARLPALADRDVQDQFGELDPRAGNDPQLLERVRNQVLATHPKLDEVRTLVPADADARVPLELEVTDPHPLTLVDVLDPLTLRPGLRVPRLTVLRTSEDDAGRHTESVELSEVLCHDRLLSPSRGLSRRLLPPVVGSIRPRKLGEFKIGRFLPIPEKDVFGLCVLCKAGFRKDLVEGRRRRS